MSRHKPAPELALLGKNATPELAIREPHGLEETPEIPEEGSIETIDSAVEVTQVLGYPDGIPLSEWVMLIELGAQLYEESEGKYVVDAESLLRNDVDRIVSAKTKSIVFGRDSDDNLELLNKALALRGVAPAGTGLSAKQNFALSVLFSPDGDAWCTKLLKLNLTQLQLDLWLKQPVFRAAYSRRSREMLQKSQDAADANLVRLATGTNSVEALKYLDKRLGRDPDRRSEMGGKQVLQIIIDVLTKHLSDRPDTLREIAAELEVRTNPNMNEVL